MPRPDAPCTATATDRPTIVALHCSASSPGQWAAYAAALAGRAELLSPPLIGYDGNPGWSSHDAARLDAEAERQWRLLHFDRKGVHLVGHSYGAAVALAMARLCPRRVCSLTLYEPIPFALLRHEDNGAPWSEIHRLASEVARCVRVGQPERAAERFINYWGDASSWAAMPARRRASVTARMAKVCREFDALFADPIPAQALTMLEMPVQVLCGSDSPPPARRTSQLVAHLCPRAELRRLPGLGHMGPVQRPDVVIPLLPGACGHAARATALVSAL